VTDNPEQSQGGPETESRWLGHAKQHTANLMATLRRLPLDLMLAMAVTSFAMAAATAYLSAHGERSGYLLKYYGSAVMVAAGEGFVRPLPASDCPLDAFLGNRRAAIHLEDIPAGIPTEPPSQFESLHRYSMMLLGGWWRLFGISWPAMDGLLSLFFGITCACAYGVLRLGMGRMLALTFTMAFLFSPGMLYVLPQFRDFGKAPFLMATLLLVGVPIRHRLPGPLMLLSGLSLGIVLGVGLGFRHDFLAVLPVVCATALLFWAGHWRATLLPRLASVALLIAAFWFTGAPILRAAHGGANSAHNIVLGFSRPYNEALGFNAPYEIGHLYRDAYAHTQISAHNLYHSGRASGPAYWGSDYEAAGRDYLYTIARTFPADIIRRALRAEIIILRDAPFTIDAFPDVFYPRPAYLEDVLATREYYFGWLNQAGLCVALMAYLMIAAVNMRWAFACVFLVTLLTGYTSLQFHVRHFFPYELFFFWFLGTLLQSVADMATAWWRPELRTHLLGIMPTRRLWQWPCARRVACAAGLAVVALSATYAGAWLWQRGQVRQLYAAYANAARTPIETEMAGAPDDNLLITKDFLPPEAATDREKAFAVQPGVLAVEVNTGRVPLKLAVVYDADSALNDFTQTITVPPTSQPETWWVYVPVFQTTRPYFDGGQRRFLGIRALNAREGAIRGVFALDDPVQLPLVLTVVLPEEFSRAPLTMGIATTKGMP
jgi:hypothetical protein